MQKSTKLHLPIAQQVPQEFKAHGQTRVDEYAYLRNADSPEVQAYIKAENQYAERFMGKTAALRRELYKEIKRRMKEDDMSVPIKFGPYLYYSRTKKGKQYAIHCRKKGEKGREEVILDENKLAKNQKYFSLGEFEISTDHRYMAYSIDTTGAEKYTLFIKDLSTGVLLDERIEAVSDFEWAEDSPESEARYLFYTVEEHPHPPRRVFRHRLADQVSTDQLIYEEA
jgi:oligopeptidase B